MPHESIQIVLNSDSSPREVADQLVALVLYQGGHDNVTVIVIDVA